MSGLAHDCDGTGPAVVLIHGFPLCRRIWQAQRAPLAAAGYRLLLPDLPGFGESPDDDGIVSMSDYADRIVELLDAYGIERAVIGGMSMGGYVLFNLIERHPQRLAGAVFAVTRAGADDGAGKAKRDAMAQLVRAQGAAPVAQAFSAILWATLTANQHPELIKNVTAWMESSSATGMAAALGAMRDRHDYTADLGRIAVPTLVIGATDDRTIPPEHSRAIAAGIPGARYVEIPDAGHLAMLEQPEAFNRALAGFLDSLPRW